MPSNIKVRVNFNKKIEELSLPEMASVGDLLRYKGLFPDAHIVLRGKTPIPLTERLRDGEEVRVIKVASGG